MQMEEMILVSVDDHVVEPPDMFKNHLTAEYLAKAPKVSRLPSGCDVWEFNGQKLPNIGLNAVVGRVPEEYGVEPTSYDQLRKGCSSGRHECQWRAGINLFSLLSRLRRAVVVIL